MVNVFKQAVIFFILQSLNSKYATFCFYIFQVYECEIWHISKLLEQVNKS